jgi:hypothetical protein
MDKAFWNCPSKEGEKSRFARALANKKEIP